MINSGLVGSTDFSGRCAARAEDAQGTPTQSHISPSILVYEDNNNNKRARWTHQEGVTSVKHFKGSAFTPKVNGFVPASSTFALRITMIIMINNNRTHQYGVTSLKRCEGRALTSANTPKVDGFVPALSTFELRTIMTILMIIKRLDGCTSMESRP